MPTSSRYPIRRKPDGTYYIDLRATGDGRRSLHTTDKAEAERKAANTIAYLRSDAGEKPRTIAELCRWYCTTIMVARGCTASTIEETAAIVGKMAAFLDSAGVRTCDDLRHRPDAIDQWITSRMRDGIKPTTINHQITRLKAVISAAVSRSLIAQTPIREWPRCKVEHVREYETLTPGEFRDLLEYFADSEYGDLLYYLAYTGCRPVDACGLTWDRVDLDGRVTIIRQSKTKRLVAIPLAEPVVAAIRRAGLRRARSGNVFVHRDSTPVSPRRFVRWFLGHSAKAIGRQVTAKVFRQTVVSELADSGADLKTIARITGHASQAIVTYRQIRAERAQSLIDGFADRMDAGKSQCQTHLAPFGTKATKNQ